MLELIFNILAMFILYCSPTCEGITVDELVLLSRDTLGLQ